MTALVRGAFGWRAGLSYTPYYTTTFVFTGLAVAVAFHAGLFNIGGEGQAMLGGLRCRPGALWWVGRAACLGDAAADGAGFALMGTAWRHSGTTRGRTGAAVVISTIMFNFIASSLLVYALVNHLRPPPMAPDPRLLRILRTYPACKVAGLSGVEGKLAAERQFCWRWRVLWGVTCFLMAHAHTTCAVGSSPTAAVSMLGIRSARCWRPWPFRGRWPGWSGSTRLQACMAKLLLEFVSGAGFLALPWRWGRNHPVGIVAASLLLVPCFGGGAGVAFDIARLQPRYGRGCRGFIVIVLRCHGDGDCARGSRALLDWMPPGTYRGGVTPWMKPCWPPCWRRPASGRLLIFCALAGLFSDARA